MQQLFNISELSLQIAQNQILNDISLQIERGQFIGIIGPNGSGKTTLLNCMSGTLTSFTGNVLLKEKPITDYTSMAIARMLAYLHQETPENLNLNVAQVVELGLIPRLSLFAAINSDERAQVAKAIAKVGLNDKKNASFNTLSGGEKQRCLLAKVIVQQPEILLMDEPTNHLDIHYQIEILSLVKQLDVSVIASFHDLNLAAAYCDELICLSNGEVIARGTPAEVLTKDTVEQVFRVPVAIDQNPLSQKHRVSFNLRSTHDETD